MSREYKDPYGGTDSQIGGQFNDFHYARAALVDVFPDQYFQPMADVTAMPKHYGKAIKKYHYIPLLDDRNINDQGIDATGATIADGNLYGSSKDVGTISGALPSLSETGGRVNRVGFTRLEIEGTMEEFGFFDEYTADSVQFDTDAQLMMHVNREMLRGASEIYEAALQIDLLNAASVIRYAGVATQDSEVTAEGADASIVDYDDFMRLNIALNDNDTPKQTTMITGSRMIDTRTVRNARYMFIGSEMEPTIEKMTNPFGDAAFISIEKYGNAGTLHNGEIGSVGNFRIASVPKMLHWAGAGASVSSNPGYRATGSNYDVFPMLVVGGGSFTTIGFTMAGQNTKYSIIHKKPGKETADRTDPYGKLGFMSIAWWYGTLILRPERIALIKAVAEQ